MKYINSYIVEKLKLNKDINIENEDLKDLLLHFEFNRLLTGNEYGDSEPIITKEEEDEIKSKLEDFIVRNKCKKETAKYYTNRGKKFSNSKIDRDYKKNNASIIALNNKFIKLGDKAKIFQGLHGLYFKASDDDKMIAVQGPYGGIKICKYE